MKPILLDIAKVRKPIKGPFLPYISRKRFERAVRKLKKGKLQPKKPYLEFVPAPWSVDDLLILPGLRSPFVKLRCRWRNAWITDSAGRRKLAFWLDCGFGGGGSPGVCSYTAIVPGGLTDELDCRFVQSTCRGLCVERHIPGRFGIGEIVQCQCEGLGG